MITGISKIKGLGVYDNYTKPAGMQPFGVKNLIYGWNYSGKTTLSRLFSQLEKRVQNPDLSDCSFTIETDDGVITEKNFTESDQIVRVFNSDFIRDNLNFAGQKFNPILLLGKESEEAQTRLDKCLDMLGRAKKKIGEYEREKSDLKSSFAAAKTTTAAHIKRTVGLVQAYTAAHLGTDMGTVSSLETSQLLTDEALQDNLKLALTPESERPSTVENLTLSPSIEGLHKEAISLLLAKPNLTSTIEHLEENPLIEKWVETGLSLHEEKDKCEFCGNDLDQERLDKLRAHFSKDLADHKRKVENLYFRVKGAKLDDRLPTETEFNPQFREKFRKAASTMLAEIGKFNQVVDTLAEEIQKKIDAPFRSQEASPLPNNLIEAIDDAKSSVNELIDDNNKLAENFSEAKARAIKKVKFHYVQEFLDEQQDSSNEVKYERLRNKRDRIKRLEEALNNEAKELQAIISLAQLGREKINKKLSSMLGSEAVQITVVSDGSEERFQLVRNNGAVARNLSDGERTAIAFCYFLTKLRELTPAQFEKTVVYIDDPISSLDANHVFQVTAAIREFFFHQVPVNGNRQWTTKCKQIFISTHNFEFFHLLREIPPAKQNHAPLFLIKRIGSQSSSLDNMPLSLSRYASEYHFLFEIIYRFFSTPDKLDYEMLLLLPNAVRRFVELYTYSRMPGDISSTVDQRATELFGSEKAKRILKVFHYFSHANTIERLAGNNELIFDVEHAIKDLLSAIESNDRPHWQALMKSINDDGQ
ncbi:AAA family ATPase [Marinobacter sp.]|uniref:AAA family ATPase n=1 Tax=Marinobacter sp. TaxID=50741 RepID=UPI0035622E32